MSWLVALDFGRYFLIFAAVRPGHVIKKPWLMASIHVDVTRLPTASWKNYICSPIAVVLSMELAVGI
eukprot:13690315-Ditylum_brightwellii.AAC.1